VLGLAGADLLGMALGLVIFFTGFNVLEATLPALVTKSAPAADKGTAMGVYSACQFLGAFAGGLGGGWLDHLGGPPLVFAGLATIAAFWLLASLPMRVPRPLASVVVDLQRSSADAGDAGTAQVLSALAGVEEAVVVAEEGVAYLKVDRNQFDPDALTRAGFALEAEAGEAATVR
jgi:MFS family permease